MNPDRVLLSRLWRLLRQAERDPRCVGPADALYGHLLAEWHRLDREIRQHLAPSRAELN